MGRQSQYSPRKLITDATQWSNIGSFIGTFSQLARKRPGELKHHAYGDALASPRSLAMSPIKALICRHELLF